MATRTNPSPVVLVHGALGSAAQLEPLRDQLRDRAVHMVELEGHGDTPTTLDRYSMHRFAANIESAMNQLEIDAAAIFGYSMGGYAALMLAATRPERVAAVMTLGTKLAWTPEGADRETRRLDPSTIRAKVPRFAEQLEQRHRGAGGWDVVLQRTAALMTELGAAPAVDDALLTKIQQPVRLMVGDRDALVSIDETGSAARKLPNGQLAVLPGTPHPIEQVRPELVASMITDFLR